LKTRFLTAVRAGNSANIASGELHGIELNPVATVVTGPDYKSG
jgi:hypothetical protein